MYPRILTFALVVSLLYQPAVVCAAGISLRAPGAPPPLSINLPANSSATIHVDFDGEFGITGASFRLVGVPEGWIVSATPNPAAVIALGDVAGSGVEIEFAECQAPSMTLFELQVFATSFQNDVVIFPQEHSAASHPVDCPLDDPSVTLCDGPVFTRACVGGIGVCINAFGCLLPDPGPLAIEQEIWSRVKSLYK